MRVKTQSVRGMSSFISVFLFLCLIEAPLVFLILSLSALPVEEALEELSFGEPTQAARVVARRRRAVRTPSHESVPVVGDEPVDGIADGTRYQGARAPDETKRLNQRV